MNLELPVWHKNLDNLNANTNLQKWLNIQIISKAMKKICHNLELKLLSTKFINNTLNRNIYLLGNNIPWSFGNVVVPEKTYLQYKNIFDNLGTKLIGESFLHNNLSVTRSSFEFCELNNKHNLFHLAVENLGNINSKSNIKNLWGRRSTFTIDNNYPLIINEIYLPDLPKFPC